MVVLLFDVHMSDMKRELPTICLYTIRLNFRVRLPHDVAMRRGDKHSFHTHHRTNMDSVQRALSQFDITLRKKKDQWETQQAKSDKEKAISVGRTFPILPPEDAFIFTALPEALTPEQQRGIAGICTLLLRAFVDDTLNKIRKTNDPALKRAVNQSLTKWTQGMLKVISSGLALDEAEKKRIRRIIEGHVNPGDIDSDDFSLGNFIREATENTDASADIVKDMYDSGILKQAQAETDTKMDKVLKSIDVRHHILLQLILISVVETKSCESTASSPGLADYRCVIHTSILSKVDRVSSITR